MGIVFCGAELWRRAIVRYVQDTRRRHQLLLIRRFGCWLLIGAILVVAFATELSTLATFAGLLTAGLALALQSVILAVVGYFFLIGKHGPRVGDRVQIGGISGEVVDIGMVRTHVMELESSAADAQPTGRIVAFSNAVVFQPTGGIFKQIPGASFVWHEVTLTLAPESDGREAEERLTGAVRRVFAEYKEKMEGQRRRLEKNLNSVVVRSLEPLSRLCWTQNGLEVVIRYPLELENASVVDGRIARALLDAINCEPRLKMVGSSTPNIRSVAEPPSVKE
jgi:small-conductance mechanosensitive channel